MYVCVYIYILPMSLNGEMHQSNSKVTFPFSLIQFKIIFSVTLSIKPSDILELLEVTSPLDSSNNLENLM